MGDGGTERGVLMMLEPRHQGRLAGMRLRISEVMSSSPVVGVEFTLKKLQSKTDASKKKRQDGTKSVCAEPLVCRGRGPRTSFKVDKSKQKSKTMEQNTGNR